MLNRATPLTKLVVYLFVLLAYLPLSAQEAAPGFVSPDEIALTECAFDKSADAVILLDKGVAFFDERNHLITERRIRLKILKEKGLERANIRIPFYSENDLESISQLEGIVLTPAADGSIAMTTLERKTIFTRQMNRYYSLISFAMPNVKVGSIIDYRYQSTMKHYSMLKRWEFQSDIPVLVSSYELAPLTNSEFAYSVYKSPEYPIQITPNQSAGKILFVMNNIPGLRNEVYMTTTKSFLQRVNFQFASYTDYMGKKSYTSTWKQLADELIAERAFGSQAGKDLSGTSLIKNLPPTLSPLEKLKSIYQFVRKEITWNEFYSRYSEDGVKNVLEKKKGNSGDINLLLVSLLRSAGLTAYPVLVCERDQGLIDTTYSFLGQFTKVVALAEVDGNKYVLDGTDQHTPFFMVPADLVNTIGFIVDRKKYGFLYFNNLPHKQQELISITGMVHEDGTVTASANVLNNGYAKLSLESRFKKEEARYLEALLKPHSFLKTDSFSVSGLQNDSLSLKEELRFHYDLKKSGGYYLLNFNLFTGLTENPFITQYRFTDIDFGTKYSLALVGNFALPANLKPESLPANKKLVSPDRTMSVSRMMEKRENAITVQVQLEINQEKYPAEDYEIVKAFFKEVVDLLNEPVLVKTN